MRNARRSLGNAFTAIRREGGFTLIELLIVIVLVGITSAMFETTMGGVVKRSNDIQGQNILQTEVRASLNQFVSDLRDASYGDITPPAVDFGANYITFYSPDHQTPSHMRKIRYWVDGTTLKRQVITSTNTDCPTGICPTNTPGPAWIRNGTDLAGITLPTATDPVEKLFGSIQNPTAVFRYCIQSPPDMTVDPSNSTSAELITWKCTDPRDTANTTCPTQPTKCIKSIIVRTVIAPLKNSTQYNYGTVATLRWNAT